MIIDDSWYATLLVVDHWENLWDEFWSINAQRQVGMGGVAGWIKNMDYLGGRIEVILNPETYIETPIVLDPRGAMVLEVRPRVRTAV